MSLEDIAVRQKLSVEALLVSPPPIWRTQYPLSELTGGAIERASLLRRALARALARLHDPDLTSAGFERLGVEDHRRTFGHAISTRHWRRLFRRTLDRDGGAKNCGRLEIYLDEAPARRSEYRKHTHFVPAKLLPLQQIISSFKNPAEPTDLEKNCLWIYVFEHFEHEVERGSNPRSIKRSILRFLNDNASFLGKSEKGIKLQFDRKLRRWISRGRVPAAIEDARRRNRGRLAPKLSAEEEKALIAKSLRSGGGLAQAWRESREKGIFSATISQHYMATPARKSYVPNRIRQQISHKLQMLRGHHRGPRTAKLNGAYVNRDPSTFHSGDWFQADDVTLPNYYYIETEEGFQMLRGQFLAMCDCRTTFILGYVLIPQRNYTCHHIRNLTTIVADTYGLPRRRHLL